MAQYKYLSEGQTWVIPGTKGGLRSRVAVINHFIVYQSEVSAGVWEDKGGHGDPDNEIVSGGQCRMGVRGGNWCIDIELQLNGFVTNTEDTSWKCVQEVDSLIPEYRLLYSSFSTEPDLSVRLAQNKLFITLVNNGIFEKIAIGYLFAQHSGGSPLVNIKDIGVKDAILAYTAGGANPAFIEFSGYTQGAGGVSYIRTQFTPSSDWVDKDDMAAFVFLDDVSSADRFAFGTRAGNRVLYMTQNYTGSFYTAINNDTATFSTVDTETRGFFGAVRLASNSVESYINQKKFTGNTVSSDLSTYELILQNFSNSGTPFATGFCDNNLSFFILTSKLVTAEVTILRQAIGHYMREIGRGFYNFVCDGDSLTAGSGSTGGNTYPKQLSDKFLADDSARCIYSAFGVAGQTLTQMESDAAAQIDVLYDTLQDTLICWGGVNDLGTEPATIKETVYARYLTYCTNRKAAGWKVYALTMLVQGYYARATYDADRLWINNKILTELSLVVDGIIDVASDARLDDYNDATYFDDDLIHLNNTGYGVVSELVYNEVSANVLKQ